MDGLDVFGKVVHVISSRDVSGLAGTGGDGRNRIRAAAKRGVGLASGAPAAGRGRTQAVPRPLGPEDRHPQGLEPPKQAPATARSTSVRRVIAGSWIWRMRGTYRGARAGRQRITRLGSRRAPP
jgi:hypothetical protein